MTNEPHEPTEADLARLLAAMIALEPEFRGVPGWRLRELGQRLAHGMTDPPSAEEIAAALEWVNERVRTRNREDAWRDAPGWRDDTGAAGE